MLREHSSLFMPMSVGTQWTCPCTFDHHMTHSRQCFIAAVVRQFPGVTSSLRSHYQTSSVLASCIDTMSLAYRAKLDPRSMQGVVQVREQSLNLSQH